MDIEIKHCNNIESAKITLVEKQLNIKLAPNGTGKSTIAKAISYGAVGDRAKLDELIPFKFRETKPEDTKPQVAGIEHIKSVMCFDESYVNQFVFQQDELLRNSFNILLRDEAYIEKEKEIEKMVAATKQFFTDNLNLETLNSNFQKLCKAFSLTKKGEIKKTCTGARALKEGNKVYNIPEGLGVFEPFIHSDDCVPWIAWQAKGCDFEKVSTRCPFCSAEAAQEKEYVRQVKEEYDGTTIKNLLGIVKVIEELGDYFSDEARATLSEITKLKDGLEMEHESYLARIKNQLDDFIRKLKELQSLSGFHFKAGEKVSEKLQKSKIDLQFFPEFKSKNTEEVINPINASIDDLIEQAGVLQGKINTHRRKMQLLIEEHQLNINSFLRYAGYKYQVEIVGEEGQSQLKLRHIDYNEYIVGGSQYLSFGEKNAFAIVLFMHECLAKKPDLIILDDPISSFDKNKKFAIFEMLFRRKAVSCLLGNTVLMLTHDVEPIIDTVKSLKEFQNQTEASFLKLCDEKITEQVITKDNIQTFYQICQKIIKSNVDEIIKLIYLRRRVELSDDNTDAYHVLSNLLHRKERACYHKDGSPEMEDDRFRSGCAVIRKELPDFCYKKYFKKINDESILTKLYIASSNGYEKLQLYRILMECEGGRGKKDVHLKKFYNETFHIENEFIFQLDPTEFDIIPEYVIAECDRIIAERQDNIEEPAA